MSHNFRFSILIFFFLYCNIIAIYSYCPMAIQTKIADCDGWANLSLRLESKFRNFVGKFVSLWQNGIEASLHVDSKAGEATVSLQVGLGHALPLQQHPLPKSWPYRLRRRQRRAEARRTAEEVSKSNAEETGLKVDVDGAVQASKSPTVEK